MSEMVERVAAAIDDKLEECHVVLNFSQAQSIARAAIAAMREPTQAMIEAGAISGAAEPIEHSNFADAWRNMIDTALK